MNQETRKAGKTHLFFSTRRAVWQKLSQLPTRTNVITKILLNWKAQKKLRRLVQRNDPSRSNMLLPETENRLCD
jgi:hypothetical protein